jgi:hypothetical protein
VRLFEGVLGDILEARGAVDVVFVVKVLLEFITLEELEGTAMDALGR